MISLQAQRVLYQQETGDYPIILLTINHPSLTEPIRISNDNSQRLSLTNDFEVIYGTISNGQEYIFFPAKISWPTEDEESPPQTTLTVSNIGRDLVSTIRNLHTSPTLTMTLVLASDPDTIEGEFSNFVLSDITVDEKEVSGALTIDTGATEPFPFRTFTPSTSPGNFKG